VLLVASCSSPRRSPRRPSRRRRRGARPERPAAERRPRARLRRRSRAGPAGERRPRRGQPAADDADAHLELERLALELIDATGPPIRNLAGVAHDGTRLVDARRDLQRRALLRRDLGLDVGGRLAQLPGENPGVRDHTRMVLARAGAGDGPFRRQNGASFPSDTWSLEGDTWRRDDVPGPPPRVHHAMEYQASGSRVLVFGGNDLDGDTLGDTWSWERHRLDQLGRPITPRSHAIMAGNPERGVLLLGGFQPSLAVLRFTENRLLDAPRHPAGAARPLPRGRRPRPHRAT
jgi:hypothetical protein